MSGNPRNRRANDSNRLNRNARPYIPNTERMPTAEQQDKVNGLRELYHGRFEEGGLADLLKYLNWDEREAAKHLQELPTGDQEIEQSDPRLKDILANLRNLQSTGIEDIWHTAQSGKIKTPYRLFACADCNHEWWKRVPMRKPVSKCPKCRVKYDPIPREFEWGWATFNCPSCGNEFSGFGQMGKTESPCFRCSAMVKPSKIQPGSGRKGPPKTKSRHQCNAPDCHSHRSDGAGSGAGVWNQRCVHPRTRSGLPMASRKHISTGSTVDTFLPQNSHPKETIFAPPLGGIFEEDEEEDE